MKKFLALVVGVAVALGAAAGSAAAQGEVVFAGPGGTNQQAFIQKVLPVFEKKTGIRVIYNAASVLEALTKAEAQRNNPEFDVIVVTDDGYAAFRQKGLFEELTPEEVPNINDIYEAVSYPGNRGVLYRRRRDCLQQRNLEARRHRASNID
jgi:putative spermidine/putrescine transport system substrate-binding protein